MLICLGHLGKVVLGSLGRDVHALETRKSFLHGRLRLAVEEEFSLEVVVHGIVRDVDFVDAFGRLLLLLLGLLSGCQVFLDLAFSLLGVLLLLVGQFRSERCLAADLLQKYRESISAECL